MSSFLLAAAWLLSDSTFYHWWQSAKSCPRLVAPSCLPKRQLLMAPDGEKREKYIRIYCEKGAIKMEYKIMTQHATFRGSFYGAFFVFVLFNIAIFFSIFAFCLLPTTICVISEREIKSSKGNLGRRKKRGFTCENKIKSFNWMKIKFVSDTGFNGNWGRKKKREDIREVKKGVDIFWILNNCGTIGKWNISIKSSQKWAKNKCLKKIFFGKWNF